MVSKLSTSCMAISFLISLFLPIVLMIIAHKRYNSSIKVFFYGMIAYFIAAQIVQAPILKILLDSNEYTAKFLNGNAVIYSLFTALVAALLQFAARFIYFKHITKNTDSITNGISFGLGFGGFESIFIGSIVAFNALSYALLINSGKLESSLQSANISSEQISEIFTYYTSTPAATWTMIGVERIFLLLLQISLALIVYYALKHKKNNLLYLSILLQIIANFPAGLYSMKVIDNIYLAEALTGIISIIVFIISLDLTKEELKPLKPAKEKNYAEKSAKKSKHSKV